MKYLKLLREKKGITQKVLAQKLGITRSYLSSLENEKKNPSLDLFVAICEELDFHPCLFTCWRFKKLFPACVNCKHRYLKDCGPENYEQVLDIIIENRNKFLEMANDYGDIKEGDKA